MSATTLGLSSSSKCASSSSKCGRKPCTFKCSTVRSVSPKVGCGPKLPFSPVLRSFNSAASSVAGVSTKVGRGSKLSSSLLSVSRSSKSAVSSVASFSVAKSRAVSKKVVPSPASAAVKVKASFLLVKAVLRVARRVRESSERGPRKRLRLVVASGRSTPAVRGAASSCRGTGPIGPCAG